MTRQIQHKQREKAEDDEIYFSNYDPSNRYHWEVRTESAADKLIIIAAATCQNHLSCIRLFSLSTAFTHIFVNLWILYLICRLKFQAYLFQISSNPCKSIKTAMIRTVTLWFLWAVAGWHLCTCICTGTCSYGNMNGVQSLRHYKFRLLSMYVLIPGGEWEVTAGFVRDLCSSARSYLRGKQTSPQEKKQIKKSRLKGISLRW